jgi:hypothetical protein
MPSVCWADIPRLSAWDAPCPAAWQQCWQQSWWNGADPPTLVVFKTGVVSSISWCPSCANGNLLCHRLALIPHISRVLTTSLQIAVSARAVTAYQGCGALGSVREVPQRSEVNGRLMARQDCPGPGRRVPEDHGWDIRDDVQRRAAAARWRAHR